VSNPEERSFSRILPTGTEKKLKCHFSWSLFRGKLR